MIDIISTISTNLFRTIIVKKYMEIFFDTDKENNRRDTIVYCLFYFFTATAYLLFHFPPITIAVNIFTIYLITQLYEGSQKKKALVTLLIYSLNMMCDILAVYSLSDYTVGGEYNEIVPYITVFLFCIFQILIEKFIIKKKGRAYTPFYCGLLLIIPLISIFLLIVLIMCNLNNRRILVVMSGGILLINVLIFYLYNALLDTCIMAEEKAILEKQSVSYANQIEVLMQSEDKIRSLQHDMKHHLKELISLADSNSNEKLNQYLYAMQESLINPDEYVYSGNAETDSLLNFLIRRADQLLNKVEYKINIPSKLAVSPFDINIICGNLLDNGITAAAASQEKWLYISINYEKGILFIHVKNSYNKVLPEERKIYQPAGKERGEHGIGLQSVKRTVNKYNGEMVIKDDNNIFDVKVMLYL